MNDLRKGLNETLEALLITLSEENIKLIEEYISMLFKWRARHNIVSTKDPEYFLKRDFFLTVLDYFQFEATETDLTL